MLTPVVTVLGSGAFGEQAGHERRASQTGLVLLQEETQLFHAAFSLPCTLSLVIRFAGFSIWDFPASHTVRSKG